MATTAASRQRPRSSCTGRTTLAMAPPPWSDRSKALDARDTLAFAAQLPRLNLPARVVWGVADKFQKIEVGERLARDLHAPLRRIEGARHFTPEDHPETVAEEINLLLEEVRNARRPPVMSR
jgi:pimeloyl-ACP methyl ester carboxylesterase